MRLLLPFTPPRFDGLRKLFLRRRQPLAVGQRIAARGRFLPAQE